MFKSNPSVLVEYIESVLYALPRFARPQSFQVWKHGALDGDTFESSTVFCKGWTYDLG